MDEATLYLILSIVTMAVVTYLVRMLPLAVFRKKIKSRLALDFLYYVPYAVLSAMTIPAVFTACADGSGMLTMSAVISSAAGFFVALALAYFERGLLTVAVSACVAAFAADYICGLCGVI